MERDHFGKAGVQRPSSVIYDILLLTNSTLLTTDMVSTFPFPYKNAQLSASSLHPHLT